MNNTQYLLQRHYNRLGIPTFPDPETLRREEWSHTFAQLIGPIPRELQTLMRQNLVMGAFRYGRLGAEGKPRWNRMKDIQRRLALYAQNHNLEHVVDCLNLAMCEYVEGYSRNPPFPDRGITLLEPSCRLYFISHNFRAYGRCLSSIPAETEVSREMHFLEACRLLVAEFEAPSFPDAHIHINASETDVHTEAH